MLAVAAAAAFDDDDWVFEPKLDGGRVLAFVDRGTVTLWGRRVQNQTAWYPELARLGAALPGAETAVLDGEVVCAGDDGTPSFSRLQHRFGVVGPSAETLADHPVAYVAFDLLWLDGEDLRGLPLEERRVRCDAALVEVADLARARAVRGAGRALFAEVAAAGLEGVVAKRLASRYRPGVRSRDWLKVKLHDDVDVVICGWTQGRGRRAGGIGSLVMGAHDGTGRLVHVGQVGTGFSDDDLGVLAAGLGPLRTAESPFPDDWDVPEVPGVTWVRPEVVAVVRHRGWGGEGRLRAPSFLGIRSDKDPEECVLEPPEAPAAT